MAKYTAQPCSMPSRIDGRAIHLDHDSQAVSGHPMASDSIVGGGPHKPAVTPRDAEVII